MAGEPAKRHCAKVWTRRVNLNPDYRNISVLSHHSTEVPAPPSGSPSLHKQLSDRGRQLLRAVVIGAFGWLVVRLGGRLGGRLVVRLIGWSFDWVVVWVVG